jgi:hypothetical protein
MTKLFLFVFVFCLFAGLAAAQDQGVQLVQNNCCNCDPHDTDMQCFMDCNAELPRCRPPAPRPLVQQRSAFTNYCCAEGRVYSWHSQYGSKAWIVGGPCSVPLPLLNRATGVGCLP